MNSRPYNIASRYHQQGLTLVEIMVALTVSLVLMAGIIQIFIGNKQTFRLQEGLSRMQENARFALDFMSRDIRQAGYVGCIRSIGGANKLIKNTPSSFSPETGVQGWEFTGGTGTAPGSSYDLNATAAAPVETTGNNAGWTGWSPTTGDALDKVQVMSGSDIIRIWRGDGTTLRVNDISLGTDITINTEPGNTINAGDVVLLNDCVAADWMQVCNVSNAVDANGNPASDLAIAAAGGGCTTGNDITNPPASLPANAEVIKLEAGTYFVGKRDDKAINTPSLYYAPLDLQTNRSSAFPQELVQGVDSMQILYGEDTNQDGIVDGFLTADNVGNWNDVLTVRIGLLLRTVAQADTQTHGGRYDVNGTTLNLVAKDYRPRRVFTSTIVLRNRNS